MNIKTFLFIILTVVSVETFGQTKSLRELLLESDLVAVTEKIPNPFYPNENKISFSDHQSAILIDSLKIISYFKKGKIDLSKHKVIIKTDLDNGFFQSVKQPGPIEPVNPNTQPIIYKTILFAKTHKNFVEVLYYLEMNEKDLTNIENFILWMNNTQKVKNEEEKCELYLKKYFSMLENNIVINNFFINNNFLYFENILLPTSNFMLYYKAKTPKATLLTRDQNEQLKNYVFDDCFHDIENTNLVYTLYPEETVELYKIKLTEINI